MSIFATLSLTLFLLLLIAFILYLIYIQLRARRSGLPPPPWQSYIPFLHASRSQPNTLGAPTPRSRSALDWVKDTIDGLRHGKNREARGNYEGGSAYGPGPQQGQNLTAYNGAGGPGPGSNSFERGRGRERGLDGEDHGDWDTSVGDESGTYAHGGGAGAWGGRDYDAAALAPTPGLDDAFGRDGPLGADVERGRTRSRDGVTKNPFADENEVTELRGVSPRPVEEVAPKKKAGDSPTAERKSLFRESL